MHQNNRLLTRIQKILTTQMPRVGRRRLSQSAAVLVLLLVSACATTPPDPNLLNNAQVAITRATQAGGDVHAPLELRLANRRLVMAEEQIAEGNIAGARHLADQAQIEAELAFARTRAALARAELQAKREAFEALQANLVEAYGEEVLP